MAKNIAEITTNNKTAACGGRSDYKADETLILIDVGHDSDAHKGGGELLKAWLEGCSDSTLLIGKAKRGNVVEAHLINVYCLHWLYRIVKARETSKKDFSSENERILSICTTSSQQRSEQTRQAYER